MPKTILLTGAAGFIGSHVAAKLLERGDTVIGVDNVNDYYDPQLKRDRLKRLQGNPAFSFNELNICDAEGLRTALAGKSIDHICHLAAQAGVRYSLENPLAYAHSNLVGSIVIFELARELKVPHVSYASSSSVYGDSTATPFTEDQRTDQPLSLYAATKKSLEVIAHSYFHIHGIQNTGLRFFTVYGPWGRPDMAFFRFAAALTDGTPIDLYASGEHVRDFTFIDDIVRGVIATIDTPLGCEILNLGGGKAGRPDREVLALIEKNLGKTTTVNLLPGQPGESHTTSASVEKAGSLLGWKPEIGIEEGVERFCAWFKEYYPTLVASKKTSS